jgi:hypothetical protein
MSKISNSGWFKIIRDIKFLLYKVIETQYSFPSTEEGSIRDVQKDVLKKEAEKIVEALTYSIRYKIELLEYKLYTIKTFDWDKYHYFKTHQDDSEDKKVCQTLHGGSFLVSCSNKETMEHFIYSEITSFISNISGIIDNIALLIKHSFGLDIKGDVLLNKVYDQLSNGALKDCLQEYTNDRYNFWGMRKVRKACEHQDLSNVFPYRKPAGLGAKDLGMPYISSDIKRPDLPEDNRVDIYCEFLHEKICDFLQKFAVALSKSVSS